MDGHSLAFATVVTRNYFHFATAWAHNIQATHPEAAVYICVVDRFPESVDPWQDLPGGVRLVYADELPISDRNRFLFQYTPFEAACALKPFILEHVLNQGHNQAIYLDSDTRTYRSMAELLAGEPNASVAITPHLIDPLPEDGKEPNDLCLTRAGTYNGGLVGVANTPQGQKFVSWWRGKCEKDCVVDVAGGLFVDQRWLDLVPGLFNEVRIHRRVGFHTAYWNLPERNVTRGAQGEVLIDDLPLTVFHFSGAEPSNPRFLSAHHNRPLTSQMAVISELLRDYTSSVIKYDRQGYSRLGYEFNTLRSGTPIRREWREACRIGHPLLSDVENPFEDYFTPDLRALLEQAGRKLAHARKDWRLNGPPKSKVRIWWKSMRRYLKPAA